MLGFQGLLLDVYRGILEMAGECLEFIALWKSRDGFGVRVVLRVYLEHLLVAGMTPA